MLSVRAKASPSRTAVRGDVSILHGALLPLLMPGMTSLPLWRLSCWTVAYVLLGKLGLLLAVPPGYASAIFPPAGIALAGMLVDGAATLPFTFIGSLALNAWEGYSLADRLGLDQSILAIGIAFASTIQAGIAGWAMHRVLTPPYALASARELIRFVALCPLCSVIAASLAHGLMFVAGTISLQLLASSWVTWWVGDTLGMLLMVPIILAWLGAPPALWRKRRLSMALPMAASFAIFVVIFIRVSAWENDQRLIEYRLESQRISDRIQEGLNQQTILLSQLANVFSAAIVPITKERFAELVRQLPANFPHIQAIEWSVRVTAAQRSLFEAQETSNFAIREREADGTIVPAATRPEYFPVTFVEPFAGNEEALGFDLLSVPARRVAISKTFEANAVAATAPVRLVQEHGSQAGILLLKAVPKSPNGSGVVLTVLRMEDFINGFAPGRSELSIEVRDQSTGEALFNSNLSGDQEQFRTSFVFGGREYHVSTAPTAGYFAKHVAWESWAVLVVGVLSSALLGALLMLGTGQAYDSERLLAERTRELEESHERIRHAQRMEAIGQLTGGVAHDFNNLLHVINGNIEVLKRRISGSDERRLLDAIERGAQRGSKLTSSLLAFSRQQTLTPEIVDVNERLREFEPLLEKAAGIASLDFQLNPVSGRCRVDSSQFQAAMLNLVANARDACNSSDAKISICTKSIVVSSDSSLGLTPGRYILVQTQDTGIGMVPEVAERAFEPFYTTKEVGKGSGLGLSQVYGFARQSGGLARILSRPKRGTTIELYLPIADEAKT